MRTLPLLLTALLAGAALAGCTGGDDSDSDPTPATATPGATPSDPFATPTATTPGATPPATPPTTAPPALDFTLAVAGAATQAKPNQTTSFTLHVNGTATTTTEHVGAHYANNATASPPGAGRSDCPHQGGVLPGSFNVSCTFAATGTWHVFGHAQANDGATVVDWWAPAFAIRVRDYNLTLAGVPTTAADETNFSFTLNVTALGASDNATSNHIGAHYFNNTTDSTTETAAGTCEHTTGGVVGPHRVTCNIDAGGLTRDVYVRGHVRITEGDVTLSWWSEPYKVTLSPVGGIGIPSPPI